MQFKDKNNTPGYGYWLVTATLLILIVLFTLPGIGQLARIQFGMLIQPPHALINLLHDLGVRDLPDTSPEARATQAPVAETDYSDALVAALTVQETDHGDYKLRRRQQLTSLLNHFPQHQKEIYAHLLRYDTMGTVRMGRDGEVELFMTGKPLAGTPSPVSTPEALAAFNADAMAGEKVDPDNAYFPLMHAVGLFAAHQDADGLAEIERAGNKSRYDDYSMNEATNRWKHLQHQGAPIALARMSIMFSLLFPHYSQIRAAARFAEYQAAQTELAGQTQKGFAIRQAIMHTGKLMRTQSRNGIGCLVGIAIETIARSHPHGERYAGLSAIEWNALSDEQHNQRRLDFYCAYLERIGQPGLVNLTKEEFSAGNQTKSIMEQGMAAGPLELPKMFEKSNQLDADWWSAMILLVNTLAMLLLCTAMLVLKKLKQDQDNQPLLIIGILCALFIVLAIRMEWAPTLHAFRTVLFNLTSTDNMTNSANQRLSDLAMSPVVIRMSACFISLLAPGTVLVLLGIKRLVKSQEAGSILARSLQTTGPILTLLLTLLYAGALLTTARHEANFHAAADRIEQHEGKYYAQLLGKTWPP